MKKRIPGKRACPKGARPKQIQLTQGLEQINLQAAGIDVGSAENYVCVPPHSVRPSEKHVRKFGVFSPQQDDLVEWLKACRVNTVAMEATGVYWMSLYDQLEAAGLEVVLVDP